MRYSSPISRMACDAETEGAGQRHSDVPAAALTELNPVENVCQFMRTSSPRGYLQGLRRHHHPSLRGKEQARRTAVVIMSIGLPIQRIGYDHSSLSLLEAASRQSLPLEFWQRSFVRTFGPVTSIFQPPEDLRASPWLRPRRPCGMCTGSDGLCVHAPRTCACNAGRHAVLALLSGSDKLIPKAHNIILAQVGAGLNLNHLEANFAGVAETMD